MEKHCRVNAEQALRVAQKLGIDWNVVLFKPADFRRGINIEMEHSTCAGNRTAVIGTSHTKAGMIALAHLREDFRYYDTKLGIPALEKKLRSTLRTATAKRKKEKQEKSK